MAFDIKTAQKLAEKLINTTFKGFNKTLTFRVLANQAYDTQSGNVLTRDVDTDVPGILGPFNNNKLSVDDFVVGDTLFVGAFTKFNFVPDNQTRVFDQEQNEYQIINIFRDAADAVYKIQLRLGKRS